jgi:hypothetical protein
MPNRLVLGTIEKMNKAGYRMVAWLCMIVGNFLAFSGVVTDMWLTNTISRGTLSDPSALSPIHTYISVLVFGGIILIVIGIGFIWRARAHSSVM